MYSSRGSNAYGQQSYAAQQAYGQNPGPEGSSMPSRHSAMLGTGAQDAEIGGYRGHPSAATHYGGPYGAVYGSSSMSSVQQVAAMSDKGAGSSALQGRTGYGSGIADSPKFASADYVSSSSHGYGHKSDQFSSGKLSDYSSIDRRHYELPGEATRRYADSVSLGQLQPEMYDHIDQASLLRQQQLLKSQSLQSPSPLEGGARQADYLAARGAPIRHATQDISAYGGRIDADPRTLSMLSGLPYGGQHQSSILGAAPRRNVDDLMYAQGSTTSGYGVSLPPGRDYGTAKGLHGTSLDSDYPGLLSRGGTGGSRMDERKDDRGSFRRELEIREEERRREHVREREKERERERERDRERERERRDRDRERERERKRVPEIRRERTPPRISRDRHGSSVGKEERPLRRDSPRPETLHRRHSPVKEKRRDYVCKVYPSCLVEVERDYLSLNKRYPKLSISPEFSKVVLNWPKENLNISFNTPVSFEHDLVELESSVEKKQPSSESVAERSGKSGATVWNAKVILMSGISKDALEELSSDKSYDDRIPHINNILRFSFLRKDRAFMAIGGPQDVVNGKDSSVDDSCLIKTVISYTKDLTQLDLQKCQHWNRFLEIHYDRIGKDGFFSHKEITVIYIPDLSECLPSLNAWRDQWLAHKKAMSERERLASQKEKKSSDKDSVRGGRGQTKSDKDTDSPRNVKMDGKLVKQVKEEKEPHGTSSEQAIDGKRTEKDSSIKNQEKATEKEKGVEDSIKVEMKDEGEGGEDGKHLVKKENEESSAVQGTDVKKPGKKKIIKKVVKQKVADKKAGDENTINTENQTGGADKQGLSEITADQDGTSVDPAGVKTFTRKKIVKKVPAGKAAQKDKALTSDDLPTVEKLEKVVESQEDKAKDKADNDSTSVQEIGVKSTGKKKIIKRVPKKKATQVEDMSVSANSKKDGDTDEKVAQKGGNEENTKEAASADKVVVEVKKSEKKNNSKPEPKKTTADKKEDVVNASEKQIKDEKVDKKEKSVVDDKKGSSAKKEIKATKEKVPTKESHDGKKEKTKDEKDKKDKDGKDDSRRKSSKEVKEKGKSEEPPKHPGLILQTKSSKESKIRSMSLSLDALLDYNDKDIEESTFELSVFAESLYEMLQYQMGCRLLTFLQKLRLSFVKKRNQRKREPDENPEKANENSSRKRSKTTEETPVEKDSSKAAVSVDANPDRKEEETVKEDASADGDDDTKMDEEADDYDPEEDVDEDQEMEDECLQNDTSKGDENEETSAMDAKPGKETTTVNVETEECVTGDKTDEKAAETGDHSKSSKDKAVVGTEKKSKPVKEEGAIVDKELLQAFRFFDRNRVGYIKVEDLRLIIHNLGKFISHRDVKELVQSALLESNTARDNRILYKKLVKRVGFLG